MSAEDDLPSVDADARQAQREQYEEEQQATALELFRRIGRPADDFAIGGYTCPDCGKSVSMGNVTVSGIGMPTFATYCCGRLIEILPYTPEAP